MLKNQTSSLRDTIYTRKLNTRQKYLRRIEDGYPSRSRPNSDENLNTNEFVKQMLNVGSVWSSIISYVK